MSGQSLLLTEYYRSVQNWINKGCPIGKPYYQVGLCLNVAVFARDKFEQNYPNIVKSTQTKLHHEMIIQFRGAGLNTVFPFNDDIRGVQIEQDEGTAYKNVQRLDWIRNHA